MDWNGVIFSDGFGALGSGVVAVVITAVGLPAPPPEAPAPADPPDGLTQREVDVLTEIGAGLSNAEIAAKFRISGATVKSHINHLLAKTGARDRGQLVGYAFRHGLAA